MAFGWSHAASAAFEVGYEDNTNSIANTAFLRKPPMRDIRRFRSPGALPLESVGHRQRVV